MTRSKQPHRKRRPRDGRDRARSDRANAGAPDGSQGTPERDAAKSGAGKSGAAGHGKPKESWFAVKRPVLRFVLVFVVLVGAFQLVFYFWISPSSFFEDYLALNARASAWILATFGEATRSVDTSLFSPKFSLEIRRGCDALQASSYFASAVLASPLRVPVGRRIFIVASGTALLLVINLVRIVTLYYVGVYYPGQFNMMHVDVWQALFILLPLAFWLIWVRQTMALATVAEKTDAAA